MELDKTAIALRQRNFSDSIDLSLLVVRTYWQPILAWAVAGIVPFALLNALLLYRLTNYDLMLVYQYEILDAATLRIRYLVWMSSMVYLQAPLALLGVTFFLGQSVFSQRPTRSEFWAAVKESLFGIVWILACLRLGIVAWFATFFIATGNRIDLASEIIYLGFICLGSVACVRSVRPFSPEILILERSPFREVKSKSEERGLQYGKRTKWLHQHLSGEHFRRSVIVSVAALFLLTSLSFGALFVSGIFFNLPAWDWWMDYLIFPLGLWIVSIWTTIIRFLSYLDTRTRLEGWELELRLRAEGKRIIEAMG